MLSQIVRPLVQTQVRLLANSHATRSTLVSTIARWLGYLGISAQVTQLDTSAERIQVSIMVGKPDVCDPQDWSCILTKLQEPESTANPTDLDLSALTPSQQNNLARLIAYLLQVGDDRPEPDWDRIERQLTLLQIGESLIPNIRSALKVPQSIEQVIKKLDPDLAAIALPIAVRVTLLDQQINSHENNALSALMALMKA